MNAGGLSVFAKLFVIASRFCVISRDSKFAFRKTLPFFLGSIFSFPG